MLNKLYVLSRTFILALLCFSIQVHAADMGVPIQLKLRAPDLSYPTQTGISVKVYILSNTGCILREEDFSNRDITEGNLTLMLGSGIPNSLPAGGDPGLTLNAVYNNSVAKSGLTCINSSNVVVGTGQTYTPAANDGRVLRIVTNDLASPITANFNMKAAPYAVQAESVGGKDAAELLTRNAGTQLNQTNLEGLLGDATKLTNLMNIANSGQALTATTATNATNATNAVNAQNSVSFTGSLAGDVTGVQSATVVSKLRGVNLSATAPTLGQVLTYDGSQYVPTTPAAATVASVNGQTGVVVLNASHIAGVVTSASALLGDVTGNVSATIVSSVGGKSAAAIATVVNDVNSATANSTAGMLVRRDGSGNISASTMSATNNSTRNIYLYEATNTSYVRLAAPAAVSNYTLTFPVNAGTAGQMLQTDGTGTLSWTSGSGVTSAGIISALGYTPANNASLANYPLKANNLSDLASATAARTNLGLGGAATLNVGTTAGTVAAGDDSRITGALQQSAFNASIASAVCTTGETMYWNSVSSEFLCQSIVLSSAQVQAAISTPTCSAGQYLTYNGTAYSCVVDSVGGAATSGAIITALGYTPADNASLANYPLKANNLSDLASATVARTNLGLGGAAVLNVGTTAGTVAAGNDSRITGAVQASAIPTCAAGQYLTFNGTVYSCAVDATGAAATSGSIISALGYTPADNAALSNYPVKANNLSDLGNVVTARSNLGLGGFATVSSLDLGSASATGTLAAARLPAFTGDATTVAGNSAITLANSGVNAGTYAMVTVDAKGRVTSGNALTGADVIAALGFTPGNNAVAGDYAQKANNLSDLTNVVTARSNLGLGGFATVSSLDLGSASATGTLAAARLPAFTGDATTVAGNSAITLANSGVAAGSYYKVTVDAKGRVTSGNALVASDITTALTYTPINRSLASTNFYVGNGSNVATAVAMSGDATMTNTGAVTLKNTGTAGTYGASNTATTFTTDAQGRVTAVSENPITITSSQVTNFASTVIATVLPGLTFTNSAVTAADSILVAVGKLQAQLDTLINPATTYASSPGSTTIASTTDALISGMTLTPAAGTYQVHFVSTMTHGTNGGVITASIYVGGTQVGNSRSQTVPRTTNSSIGGNNIATLNQTVIGEVTVNGSQAIEIRWNSSTGTAKSTYRSMIIHRVR